MAATANAFNLLVGAGEQLASAKKKKNVKKNKAKAETENGGDAHTAGESSTSPPAPKTATAPGPSTSTSTQPVVVEVNEGCAIFERAAREAKSVNDKVKLWKDWTKQATDKSAKGSKYKAADGTFLDMKQVILQSKALEISLEGCVTSGVGAGQEAALAQLLAAFLPNASGTGNAVANAVVRLSSLLADEAPDTLGAAQRAVSSIIGSLKSQASNASEADGVPVGGWLGRVSHLDKEILRQQALLQKLRQTNKDTVTKEQANSAKQVVRLLEEKLDLLQPENTPAAQAPGGAVEATLRTVEELKRVINSHLKDAQPDDAGKGKSGSSESQRAQTQAAYKREETILDQQGAEVAAQIRTLEAQLRSLKAQQTEIAERRALLQARQNSSWEPIGGKGKPTQVTALSSSHYREELAVAEQLLDLVDPRRSSGSSPQEVLSVQAAQVNTPLDYVSSGSQFLQMALKALTDIPTKLASTRQRMERFQKLAALSNDKTDTLKNIEDSERLLSDTLRMAEDLIGTSMQIVNEAHQRYDAMTRFHPEHGATIASVIRTMDAVAAQIRQQYDAVISSDGPSFSAPVASIPAPVPLPKPAAAPKPAAVPQRPVSNSVAPAATTRAPAPAPTEPAAPKPHANGSAPIPAPMPAPAAAPVPTLRPVPATPPKQWAKVQVAAPVDAPADDNEPTPAEAFKATSSQAVEDGFATVGGKKNRKKA